MVMLNPVFLKCTSLEDAWKQAVYACIDHGNLFTVDEGSYAGQRRLELDYLTMHITHPGVEPLTPQLNPELGIPNPVADGYLDTYLTYIMTGEKQPNEAYTYGSRLNCVDCTQIMWDRHTPEKEGLYKSANPIWDSLYGGSILNQLNGIPVLNQIELMIWTYRTKGHRNNQMVLQIADPSDMLLNDPPCLRSIDTRIQDNKLHFFVNFRSWDIYSGMAANLGGLELLKQYCAAAIGVESGEIVAQTKGAHVYEFCVPFAEIIRGHKVPEKV